MSEEGSEQTVEVSLDDRIANLYDDSTIVERDEPVEEPEDLEGLDEEAEEISDEVSEEAEEAPLEAVEVEWDGKVYSIPPELQSAFMKNADYTQKTQELSAQRQAVELQAQEVRQAIEEREFIRSVDAERQQLAMIDSQLQQFKGLNWDEMTTEELTRHGYQKQSLQEMRQDVLAALEQKQQKFVQERTAQHQEFITQGQQYLSKKLNGWDKDKAVAVKQYAVGLGFPEAEVSAVVNPLHVEVLYKAMQFDQLKSKQASAVKQTREAPPIVKPGSVRKMPEDVKQKLNYRKQLKSAKSDRQRADLIEQRLAQKLGID